jgi:hypothetical protein
VLLQNDNVLFGTASQQGEFVVIRRGPDSEIRLSRKDVACWAGSLRDLYQYRLDHRTTGDLSAHIRDADWCIRYDLFDAAEREIQAIRTIAPGNRTADRLQRQLQSVMAAAQRTTLPADSLVVQPAGYQDSHAELAEVGTDALRDFAINVQPMLLNRCARCHSHTSDRRWRLNAPHGGARASSRMTHENLSNSLPYIDRQQPSQSELYVKAMTSHGGAPAALHSRHSKAIAAFEAWLGSLTPSAQASEEDERPQRVSRFAGHPFAAPDLPTSPTAPTQSLDSWMNEGANDESEGRPDAPARLPQVANPFDPDLFNRRHHPE